MSDNKTKETIAICVAAVAIFWAMAWGVVAYNRAYIDAGYQETTIPGKLGTVWQKVPPQSEKP